MDQVDDKSSELEPAELCLQWHHHHDTLVSVLDTLWERQELVDVTLTAQGQSIQVHRVILCACSQYFQELLTQKQLMDKHAIVFLKDVDFEDLEAIVHYMYKGEVRINEDQLNSFLQAAKSLGIRGIMNSKLSTNVAEVVKPMKRPRLSEDAEEKEVEESCTTVLPLPPPLKHMTSLTKSKEIRFESCTEQDSDGLLVNVDDTNKSEIVWQETLEDLEEVVPFCNQNQMSNVIPGTSGQWSHDSTETNAGSGSSQEGSSFPPQDWQAASPTVDSAVLYSLLLQNCGNSEEGPVSTSGVQEGSNDSVGEEEFIDNPHDDQAESSDQDNPSNDYLDHVAAQAIVPNRRNSKKDSESRRPLYSCNRCGRIYSKKHSVLRHLRYECGVEPQFQCSICNQRFKHRSDQQRHERKIHGVEPAVYDEDGGGGDMSDNI